jgi:hypothetical protein
MRDRDKKSTMLPSTGRVPERQTPAIKLIVLVAIVLAVLASLSVLSAQRRRSLQLPNPPLHTSNEIDGPVVKA